MIELHGSTFLYLIISILGLCFGSFFNVAIYRWPHTIPSEREWIVRPSHCPACKHKLYWYHNIPVFSYIFLKGFCAFCGTKIPFRYLLIEISTLILFTTTTAIYLVFNTSGNHADDSTLLGLVLAIILASLLFLTFVIDLLKGLIPDNITIPLFIVSLFHLFTIYSISPSAASSIYSFLLFSSIFVVLWFLKVMGLGDVFFVACVSSLLGLKLSILFICLSVLLGGVFSMAILIYLALRGKYKPGISIPFGPFLSLSVYITYFFGDHIISWYVKAYL